MALLVRTETVPGENYQAAERRAMEALYNQTNGPNWIEQGNWMSSDNHCLWTGVWCLEQGLVNVIRLEGNGLVGTIPSELGDMTQMETLNLSNNQLTGEIPPELGPSFLTHLFLQSNQLTGLISEELGEQIAAKSFSLADNDFDCPHPSSLEAYFESIGEACPIVDADGDGVADSEDAFVNDPSASSDTDADGYPSNATPEQIAASNLSLDVNDKFGGRRRRRHWFWRRSR